MVDSCYAIKGHYYILKTRNISRWIDWTLASLWKFGEICFSQVFLLSGGWLRPGPNTLRNHTWCCELRWPDPTCTQMCTNNYKDTRGYIRDIFHCITLFKWESEIELIKTTSCSKSKLQLYGLKFWKSQKSQIALYW